MSTQLQKLFRHMRWADEHVLAALRASPDTEPRAISRFAHILAAEHVWLARIQGVQPRLSVWPALTLDECAAYVVENSAAYAGLVADANASAMEREVRYTNSAGTAFSSTVEDILLHVALHGAYHRGQVSIFMRESGGVPAPTDYIALARGAPAATRPPEHG